MKGSKWCGSQDTAWWNWGSHSSVNGKIWNVEYSKIMLELNQCSAISCSHVKWFRQCMERGNSFVQRQWTTVKKVCTAVMIRPKQAWSCFLFHSTAMWSSNSQRNYPLRVLSTQQVFALSPARYWRGSIQRYKLHRLSGGVPAGSQDRGHHPHWRNRRQCWGECSRVPQTTQLCKELTLWISTLNTPIVLLHSPFNILCCSTSPLQIYLFV